MLTFELIRELQIKEKEEKQLQTLPPKFYEDLKEYLDAKKEDEISKNMALDLIERRLRKILILLPSCLRAGIEPKNLSPEEREIFRRMSEIVKQFLSLSFQPIKEEPKEEKKEKILITRELKPFVWRDLKVYELKQGEVLEALPEDLKEFLLRHECCKVIR